MDLEFSSITLSVAMIAGFMLAVGGIVLMIRQSDYRRGSLMIVAALVLLGNVLIWTL